MYRILAGDTVVYDQSRPGIWSVVSPKLTMELNQSGQLKFTLQPLDEFYHTCQPFETYLSVEDDGEEVFYGRVLTRSEGRIKGTVSIVCEGALSFLFDGELQADSKSTSSGSAKYNHQTQTAGDFLARCLTAYNSDIEYGSDGDTRRHIRPGTFDHSDVDTSKEYKVTTTGSVKDAIESHVLQDYGGFIRVRHDSEGHLVLDWLEGFDNVDTSEVELGKNIIDQMNKISADNIFTVIRPIGKDGLTLSSSYSGEWLEGDGTMRVFYSEDIRNRYGRIVKSMTFSDADTEAELYTEAHEYVEKLHYEIFASVDIKMVDMHYIDGTTPKVRLGDAFSHIAGFEGTTLTVASLELDLEKPQNDHFALKNGKELESTYGGFGQQTSATSSSRGKGISGGTSSGFGTTFKYIREGEESVTIATKNIEIHADRLEETANDYARVSRVQGQQGEQITSLSGRITTIEGTGVFQNSEKITNIAGNFTITKDAQGHDVIDLIQGSVFVIDRENGIMSTNINNRFVTTETDVNGLKTTVNNISGSALWAQSNNIIGVVGQFEVVGTGDDQYIRVTSGGGIRVHRNDADFGLYDSDSLTAGILVTKLNDNTTTAQIKATRINLDGYVTATQLSAGTISANFADITVADAGSVHAKTAYIRDVMVREGSDDWRNVRSFIYDAERTDDGTGNTVELTFHRLSGEDTVITFNKAGSVTLTGAWEAGKTGKFTVRPTPSTAGNEVFTTLTHLTGTDYYHWGQASSGEDENAYYGTIGASINGGSVTAVFPFVVNALTRYNAGFDAVGLTTAWATGDTGASNQLTVSADAKTDGTVRRRIFSLGLSAAGWSSGSNNVQLRSNGSVVAHLSVTIPANSTAGWDNAYVDGDYYVSGSLGGRVLSYTFSGSKAYEDGWEQAENDFNAPITTPASLGDSLVITGPSSTVDGTPTSITYTLSADSNFIYLKYGANTIARAPNPGGGSMALTKPPTWANTPGSTGTSVTWGTSNTVTVQTADGNDNVSLGLYMTQGSTWTDEWIRNTYIRLDSASGRYVAKMPVDASNVYEAGRTAVTIAGLSWTSGSNSSSTRQMRTSTSGRGTESTYDYELVLKDGSDNDTVILTVDNLSTSAAATQRMAYTHGKYTAGWRAAYGVWKVPAAGTAATCTFTFPAYANDTTLTRTYTLSEDNSYAYLKDPNGNTVARVSNGAYQAGYNRGYELGEAAGMLKGWRAYYDDTEDWISAYDEGGGVYSVWIPKREPPSDWIGGGTSATCEEWFRYSTSGTHSPTASNASRQAVAAGDSFISGCRHLTPGWTEPSSGGMYYKFTITCGGSSAKYYFKV